MDRTIGSVREGFQLVVKTDGNYLTVYPESQGSTVIDLSTLRKRLEDEGITEYDVLQLARVVRAADGFEVRLRRWRMEGRTSSFHFPSRFRLTR